jgi:hypothetical protein
MGNDMLHMHRYIVGLSWDLPTRLWGDNGDLIGYIIIYNQVVYLKRLADLVVQVSWKRSQLWNSMSFGNARSCR